MRRHEHANKQPLVERSQKQERFALTEPLLSSYLLLASQAQKLNLNLCANWDEDRL